MTFGSDFLKADPLSVPQTSVKWTLLLFLDGLNILINIHFIKMCFEV